MIHGHASIERRSDSWSGWAALFAIAIAAVLVAQLLPAGVARAVVALPPILLLPGFAVLTLALGTSRPRDPALIGVLSVALSFAVMMLDALALNALGVRLSTASLGLSAVLSTAVLIAVASATAGEATSDHGAGAANSGVDRLRATGLRVTRLRVTGLRATRGIALVASLIAGLAAVSLVATHQRAPVAAPFTSLSLGASWAGRASAQVVHTAERVTIPVVAANRGAVAGPYQLATAVDGAVTSVASLSLSSAATWRGQIDVVAPAGSGLHRVVISLTSEEPGTDGERLVVYLDNVGS